MWPKQRLDPDSACFWTPAHHQAFKLGKASSAPCKTSRAREMEGGDYYGRCDSILVHREAVRSQPVDWLGKILAWRRCVA